jgi:hypothetical protein
LVGGAFRPPDLADPEERRLAFGLAKRVCYRADRLEILRSVPEGIGADERYEIEDLLCTYHRREPIYDGISVCKVVMALGPNWYSRDPNARQPRIKHTYPEQLYPHVTHLGGMIAAVVSRQCRGPSGLPVSAPHATTRALRVLFAGDGDETPAELQAFRESATPFVEQMVATLMPEHAHDWDDGPVSS